MKKFFKKMSFLSLVLFALQLNIANVNAASGYSFSVGTKFSSTSGDDSSDEATIANTKLAGMGYTTKLLTQPTFSTLTSSINSSRDWLESDVLYFLGHANSTTIYWDYMGKGGDYAVAIKNTNVGYCEVYWTYTGIGLYDMSKVDLGVFMGCSTASDSSSNLPKYAYEEGAKVTIGWKEDIPQADTYTWTNRFFTRLANGYTVSSAITYANNYTYSSSAIKNTKTYGSTSTTISSELLPEYEVMDSSIKSYTFNKNISLDSISADNKILDAEVLIQQNINSNFNSDNYIVELATNDFGNIYDYYYVIDGVKTNIGYTIFTTIDNSKIINIVDNMNGVNEDNSEIQSSNVSLKLSNLSEKQISEMREKALEQDGVYNVNISSKTIIDEFPYYDAVENKLYYYIAVEIVDLIPQTKSIEYYIEEITI